MSSEQKEIRIYVACLASYNNGILHDAWIDACQDESSVWGEIKAMLKASPIPEAEEHAIHDYEGFESALVEEYSTVANICAMAAFLEEHGALGGKLLEHFGDLEDAREAIEEEYRGEFKSVADFAQELTEETTQIPESLRYYIDYEAMARDLEINDILAIETGFEQVHIFWRQ